MSTLAVMKARIADELGRSDLTSLIAYAITDAIEAYQDERFHFNETRALTFNTVAGREFYDATDAPALATVCAFDYVALYVSSVPYRLRNELPEAMELLAQSGSSTGQPHAYCWYGDQLRLYPIPTDVWQVRVGASIKAAAPATDVETGNPWMTHAARLIRSRAKLELATHVLFDDGLGQNMSAATQEAFDQLKSKTNQLTQVEKGRVVPMAF